MIKKRGKYFPQHFMLSALYLQGNSWLLNSFRLRWAGHVARMGERRGAYRALVGKPEGRRPLGRPSRRWEYNITIEKWDGG
jgi:hypothetical protein